MASSVSVAHRAITRRGIRLPAILSEGVIEQLSIGSS
jgi:hypothetical protein